MIDIIKTCKRDISNIGNVVIMPTAKQETDHSFLRVKFKFYVKKKSNSWIKTLKASCC